MCKDAIVFSNKPEGVTLEARIEYYICTCGKSKGGVFCDGKHDGTACLPKKVIVEKTKQYHICLCKTSKNFPFCDGTHSIYGDEDIGKGVAL
ncbi:MAG: CDGSH iron-sulfur domain-containing protein [Sulfurimonas sp.]|uniref:CDGSH iron-sulfur domain-containing protein n=1 Tax=Sulfurimonas sp. TaxID=2022749 RepID=UPI002603F760|nr:CDGSH iron-sulfur domain-containing protein [Sulfurimonas sp.]MDD5373136.1 CDGSH iron-sulfur domain-containing protein [Sulfurimonas sp.]